MLLERLSSKNFCLFKIALNLYKSSFPIEERRDDKEQDRVLQKDEYHFDLIMDEEAFVGIMLYWDIGEWIFLEHFAILPNLRGRGYGKAALDLLKMKKKPILLEIEPPDDDMTQRRYDFYKRNGFVMNSFTHIQAKYHLGDEDLELKLLSYPNEIKMDEYRLFCEYMTREIGIRASKSKRVNIRELRDDDDLNQVARLIYLTDPFVYPNWFDCIDDGIKVIREMIELPTLYNKKNLMVAVNLDGVIVGIAVSKQTPFVEERKYLTMAFHLAKIKEDKRTEEVFLAYYSKMGGEEDGCYIANVAVDPEYRRQGIAASLVSAIIENKEYCSLECVVANTVSCRLYQRLGFKIAYEYPGVHGIPCYKMFYKK